MKMTLYFWPVFWYDKNKRGFASRRDAANGVPCFDTKNALLNGGCGMKRKLTALLLAVALLASLVPALAVPASDVKGHWAESYIETLRGLGIMEGYPDGTFRPNNNVTKAELVTLLNRTFGLKDKKSISYTDVAASKWYYEQFQLATDYVFTFSGGSAYPDTALTRQEAASMFGRLMSFTNVGDVSAFEDDASISDWAKTYIYAGAVKNLITGYPEAPSGPCPTSPGLRSPRCWCASSAR